MPDPQCPHCQGTGYTIVEKQGFSAAQPCECFTRRDPRKLLEQARIPANYWNDSLDNFTLPKADANPIAFRAMASVLVEVRSYARNFPAVEKPGLLLVGDPGTGKTHLAVAVLKILLENGHDGLFYDYQNLLDRIRMSFSDSFGGVDREAYREALDSEILLLDDLGSQRMTDWVQDTVTAIITHRCNNRLPLIATTNLPDADMGLSTGAATQLSERIGSRARSRLFEMCRIVVMPKVADYRVAQSRA